MTPPAQPRPKIGRRWMSRRQIHPLDQKRVQTGGGDAGSGNQHHAVDLIGFETGFVQQLARHFFQQIDRTGDIKFGAVQPAMIAQIPFDRDAGITPLNAGIGEDRDHAGHVGDFPKQLLRILRCIGLGDDKGWHSRFEAKSRGRM